MRKTVSIGGKDIVLDNNASILIRYKTMFGGDLMQDYNNLVLAIGQPLTDNISLTAIRIIYVMAAAADKEIKPFEDWLSDFESFPVGEMVVAAVELMAATLEIRTEKNLVSPETECGTESGSQATE